MGEGIGGGCEGEGEGSDLMCEGDGEGSGVGSLEGKGLARSFARCQTFFFASFLS